jgi:hypothetical protein
MANRIIDILQSNNNIDYYDALRKFKEMRDEMIFDGKDPIIILDENKIPQEYLIDLI